MRSTRGRWTAAAVAVALAATAGACGGDDDATDAAEAATEEPETVVHVALGDSFSSGDGAPPYDASPESCRRSAEAWPRRLDASRAEIVSVDLRACAGAQTEHLTGPWTSRNLEPQIPAEPDPSVTLVTLTIGGNDVGFGDIVASCVLGVCAPGPGTAEMEARLDTLRTALHEEVHPALSAAYPNARIVHVGYPRLVPPPAVEPQGCAWLTEEDQRLANGIVDALGDALRAAAERDGSVEYLDVSDVLADHELCTEEPWVVPVGASGGAHPDARGQRALEEAVAAGLRFDDAPRRS